MSKKILLPNLRPAVHKKIPKGFTGRDNSIIEVTEWTNGGGFDIEFTDIPGLPKGISISIEILESISECVDAINDYYYNKMSDKEKDEVLKALEKKKLK